MEYRDILSHPIYRHNWSRSSTNHFGRLAQGLGGIIKGTDTIRFIPHATILPHRLRDVTYGRFICKAQPNKPEPKITRLTVGGDSIKANNAMEDYDTPNAELLLVKVLFNSIISTDNARFMSVEIKNFYINMDYLQRE